jgi:UDP-N-acetylglucosamine 2-epimerase (non-hydrolysing)
MRPLKLMTIVGTRPEIIRLSCCITAFDNYFDHDLVHTGQNWDYTLNGVFFEELSLRPPDHSLTCAGDTLGETLGAYSPRATACCGRKARALLILGDTNSALSAIPAKRLKIPIFHMEAGNRCFDFQRAGGNQPPHRGPYRRRQPRV